MESSARLSSTEKDAETGAAFKMSVLPSPSTTSHRDHVSHRTAEFLDTIRKVRGVVAGMTTDKEGKLGDTNYDKAASGMYCGLASQILKITVPLIQQQSPTNKLRLIRSNSGAQELMIAPIENHDLTLLVVQNCNEREAGSISLKAGKHKNDKKKSMDATSELIRGSAAKPVRVSAPHASSASATWSQQPSVANTSLPGASMSK